MRVVCACDATIRHSYNLERPRTSAWSALTRREPATDPWTQVRTLFTRIRSELFTRGPDRSFRVARAAYGGRQAGRRRRARRQGHAPGPATTHRRAPNPSVAPFVIPVSAQRAICGQFTRSYGRQMALAGLISRRSRRRHTLSCTHRAPRRRPMDGRLKDSLLSEQNSPRRAAAAPYPPRLHSCPQRRPAYEWMGYLTAATLLCERA